MTDPNDTLPPEYEDTWPGEADLEREDADDRAERDDAASWGDGADPISEDVQ